MTDTQILIFKINYKSFIFFVYVCLSSSENTPRLFELPSLYVKHKHASFLIICNSRIGVMH